MSDPVENEDIEQASGGEDMTDQPPTDQNNGEDRRPEAADEDQVDQALEETFPASDPISP
jgi:hypothetical protein